MKRNKSNTTNETTFDCNERQIIKIQKKGEKPEEEQLHNNILIRDDHGIKGKTQKIRSTGIKSTKGTRQKKRSEYTARDEKMRRNIRTGHSNI